MPFNVFTSGPALDSAALEQLAALIAGHTTKDVEVAVRDLTTCDFVGLRYRAPGDLAGLVSHRYLLGSFKGAPACVIYGHLSLLDPDQRGLRIPATWTIIAWLRALRRWPRASMWVSLKASSYKSYLMFMRASPAAWPDASGHTPEDVRALRDEVMSAFYGPQWDAPRGVALGRGRMEYLAGRVATEQRALEHDEVATYARLNPHQERGDGLIMMTPADLRDVARTSIAYTRRAAARALNPRERQRTRPQVG